MMPGSSVSSVQQQGSEEGEAQATTTEAIQIWDRLIGSHLGQRALRVVLASNADDAAVLFRLRLVARRFYSELPKYVASLNFSGLSIPDLPDEIFKPFTNLSLVDLSGCRLAGTTPAGAALLVTCLSSCSRAIVIPRGAGGFLGGGQPIDELESLWMREAH